ncbi:MAG: hypothetical protein CHACPFDD_01387 [Phycisphaerae bacterium]|nr:hypothetical protein [Phycisphaerae bacterium]
MRCPHCDSVQRVPAADGDEPPRAAAPAIGPRRYFNFVCRRCNSILEAHTGLSGQNGRCPTCNAFFVVPHVDPQTGAPLPTVELPGQESEPTPVHAYAASGEQAPTIHRDASGRAYLTCGRCGAANDVEADSCSSCQTPFTLEGAAVAGSWASDGRALASCILGVIAVPGCFLFVPAVVSIVLGWMTIRDRSPRARPATALVGLALSGLSLPLGVAFWLTRL